MNTDVDPPETDAGASVSAVRLKMNELPEDVVSDAVIVQQLEAAEEFVNAKAYGDVTEMQIKHAEIARAALKTYGSDAAVKQKEAADVSKTWDTDGLRDDLNSDWDEWLELLTGFFAAYPQEDSNASPW